MTTAGKQCANNAIEGGEHCAVHAGKREVEVAVDETMIDDRQRFEPEDVWGPAEDAQPADAELLGAKPVVGLHGAPALEMPDGTVVRTERSIRQWGGIGSKY